MHKINDYLFYQDDWATIYCGDCLEIMPLMEPESVDLVVTDPPYGVDYAEWDEGFSPNLIKESRRISKGIVFAFGGCSLKSMKIYFDCHPQRCFAWVPKFELNHSCGNGIIFRWHPIWVWDLPTQTNYIKRDVLDDSQDGHNFWKHPATKPLALFEKLVQESPMGGLILDPFLGSGTTCVAAKNLNRKSIGIEINPKYCEIAVKRLKQEVFDFRKEAK